MGSVEWTLALCFFFALSISFICSLLEAVLFSVSREYVESQVNQGHTSGSIMKGLKGNIDRPLSAILTLNTVSHTVGAAGVGASALTLWGDKWVAVVSAVLTLCILVFSEIIPKTLGAVYCKKLMPSASYTIRALVWGLFPVVIVLEYLSSKIAPTGAVGSKTSREEMHAIAELGRSEGTLHYQETRVIQNLLALKNIRVKDILTPRSVVLAFKKDELVSEIVQNNSPIRFSRIPIYGKDLDDINGVVNRYKILQSLSNGQGKERLDVISQPIHIVPDTKSVASTLDEFVNRREQLFLVVDEYGGTEGIVTLEDVIETLLGVEIVDEYDAVQDMRKLARQLGQSRQRYYQKQFDSHGQSG
jgi:CBS domain containing-hemolysin-like protein